MTRTMIYLNRLGLVAMGASIATCASNGIGWPELVLTVLAAGYVVMAPGVRR